jgi:hypothetical protein
LDAFNLKRCDNCRRKKFDSTHAKIPAKVSKMKIACDEITIFPNKSKKGRCESAILGNRGAEISFWVGNNLTDIHPG